MFFQEFTPAVTAKMRSVFQSCQRWMFYQYGYPVERMHFLAVKTVCQLRTLKDDLEAVFAVDFFEVRHVLKSRLGNQQVSPHTGKQRVVLEVAAHFRIGDQKIDKCVTGKSVWVFNLQIISFGN